MPSSLAEQLSAQRTVIEQELMQSEGEISTLDPEADGAAIEVLLDRLEQLRRHLRVYGATAAPPPT
jgi:hypothetical protein